MKNYEAFLVNRATHKVMLSITFKADGYLTALDEARKLCSEQHPELYVSQVVQK